MIADASRKAGDLPNDMERLLRRRFAENPFPGHVYYPDKALGHGCAEWAVGTVRRLRGRRTQSTRLDETCLGGRPRSPLNALVYVWCHSACVVAGPRHHSGSRSGTAKPLTNERASAALGGAFVSYLVPYGKET